MKNIKNVVDFGEILGYAEEHLGIFWNAAHSILADDFYPRDGMWELHRGEVDQYTSDPQAVDIMTKFMDHQRVKYINLTR